MNRDEVNFFNNKGNKKKREKKRKQMTVKQAPDDSYNQVICVAFGLQ